MMAERQYLTLLRGINVGGNNIIKMTELKACFEDMGFKDVATYIQSGNVLFQASDQNHDKLTDKIEKALSKRFNYKSCVVVVSHEQLKSAVEHAPRGFGEDTSRHRYDVIFLKKPLSASEAMKSVSIKKDVDQAYAGKDVLYFSRLISKASQSNLPRLIRLPVYQNMTIRKWNTTTKLLALMDARAQDA
jgi:uncharacterized protein (DUF1697 family)